ncbi:WYL domain-containing protein [Providencia rustigianii]|uniref:helix-turn-helix transcriptional regulator n=1 Tax=Providencia rustigianii TaxID=158850 RepID=UPI000F6CCDA7|nr:WYL domain-containing protein [Providencia rustigianii]MTC61481.1 WYL domain-containing protein [Providencia rustigianii]VEH56734.1 DeoR-like helix-turn-helix domain [Providencia rustigianii]
MSTSVSRHDRLASRLAFIISQLFRGETVYLAELSEELNVSTRTLRRDFNERLQYLDLEYHQGGYRLAASQRPFRTDKDILRFAAITHITSLFPALDRKLLTVLLDPTIDSPFIVYHTPPEQRPSLFGGFYALTQAIVKRRLLQFAHQGKNITNVAPYKLIYYHGHWYLAADIAQHIHVFDVMALQDVIMTARGFRYRETLNQQLCEEAFIQALPHYQYIQSLFKL